ncbi:hypothetical protein B0H16DRAFT_1717470 [Mycena metata]|uniref:Uncharacterized protein n=1 Tax=Mycena metata TaxID=1033252 RepID=A0AAD7JMA7_9AGAR|nr:hypothetical protein B0H16DRAFT_1717470 [Mycena metata]
MAQQFADEEGLLFTEASAKSGEAVEEAFIRAAQEVLSKVRAGRFDDSRLRAWGNGILGGRGRYTDGRTATYTMRLRPRVLRSAYFSPSLLPPPPLFLPTHVPTHILIFALQSPGVKLSKPGAVPDANDPGKGTQCCT